VEERDSSLHSEWQAKGSKWYFRQPVIPNVLVCHSRMPHTVIPECIDREFINIEISFADSPIEE